MLFDRGFAMSGTGSRLETLSASAISDPPNMRDQVCRGRGRAEMLAMQEDFVTSAMAQAPAGFLSGRGGSPMMMTAAMAAPPPVGDIADEKVTFDPIPVFVGPKPGYKGPVLAARGEEKDSPVSAFTAQKEDGVDETAGAPAVLRSAVKTPPRRHMTPQARARQAAAISRVVTKRKHAH
jgi:hypothetical protein